MSTRNTIAETNSKTNISNSYNLFFIVQHKLKIPTEQKICKWL